MILLTFQLLEMRNDIGKDYFKSHLDLEEKKERMFMEGQTSTWGIDTAQVGMSMDSILKNREIAKFLMLPDVNNPILQT